MNAVAWLEELPGFDRWRGRLFTRAPQVVTGLLALALAVQAALILTRLAGAGQAPTAATAQSRPTLAATRSFINVAAIANAHLFGAATAAPTASVDAAQAPQTSAPLVLTGIIAGDDPGSGMAIVGESANAAKVYAVGDHLPGGVKLHSVLGDRVLLERNGQVEALSLPRQARSGGGAPPVAANASGNPALDRMRRIVAQEPGLIADIMRPQPVIAQGKQRGYRVYPGRNRQAFLRLGLRPGDLIVAVNGTPLDDPARAEEIFRTIGASSEARVTVMRNGRQQDLALNIAQVASDAEQLVNAEGTAGTEQTQPVPEPVGESADSGE